MRKLLLLRPEPGLSASADRARDLGLDIVACPLFRVEPVEWTVPNPADYDALLLTSQNAVGHGGNGLTSLRSLPVYAVGSATAARAAAAGFRIETTGEKGVEELLAPLPGSLRLLHLSGKHRRTTDAHHGIDTRIVYQSVAVEEANLPDLEGLVVAVHSSRAGARLAEFANLRDRTAIAAISAAAAAACGIGWERVEVAERPDDPSLLALAAMLCHTSPPA